jgi:hypothetical protein
LLEAFGLDALGRCFTLDRREQLGEVGWEVLAQARGKLRRERLGQHRTDDARVLLRETPLDTFALRDATDELLDREIALVSAMTQRAPERPRQDVGERVGLVVLETLALGS